MTTAIDHARLVKGARVKAPADHPCGRWAMIVHLYRHAPVARLVCDCGWRGDVPLRRLEPEPVPQPRPTGGAPQSWTRERVIEALRAWAAEHGRAPSFTEWQVSGGEERPCAHVVQRRFGSWTAGLRAAGLEPTGRRRRAEEGA